MLPSKVCTKCKVEKLLTEFPKQNRTKDKRSWHCKECANAYARSHRKIHKRTPEDQYRYNRNAYCKMQFGMTPQEYDNHLAKYDNCEICNKLFGETARKCLDHNHITHEIRGVICDTCNKGIGLLRDDPEIVQSALTYLTQRGYYGGPNRTGPTTSRRKKAPTDGLCVVC